MKSENLMNPSETTQVKAYWDRHADIFSEYYKNPSWFDRTFRQAIYVRAATAFDVCKSLGNPSVLDIGSGPGVNSVALVKKAGASKVTGIDFAANMIELAKKYALTNGISSQCDFITGDFMTHQFEPESFDLVIALGVFDYIGEVDAFFDKMRSVARKAMVASWPENGLRMALRRVRYSCPVYHYTESRIRDLHQRAGVKHLELIKTPGGWVSKATL
jgi:2-polyprenyl-3-methyl-5-hydroxy-6-metoxy-1,4-benzoquinol methylase